MDFLSLRCVRKSIFVIIFGKVMKTIEVVAAIIRKGDKIFATQRGYGGWKDWWEFPGGKVPLESKGKSLK